MNGLSWVHCESYEMWLIVGKGVCILKQQCSCHTVASQFETGWMDVKALEVLLFYKKFHLTPILNWCCNFQDTVPGFILILFNEPGQTEIGNLADIIFSHQYVSGSQISMDVVLSFQVGHASCDLSSHVYQLWKFQSPALTLEKMNLIKNFKKGQNGMIHFFYLT